MINILNRFELYIPSNSIAALEKNMTKERMLEYKIKIWAIKELYLSPYKVGLNTGMLTYEKIMMKYLKTKKYICSKEKYTIIEFLNYFIACLQKVLENY